MAERKTKNIVGDLSVGGDITMGGKMTVKGCVGVSHDLRVYGFLEAPNIRDVNKGLFASLEELVTAYPRPKPGWWASIGNNFPADVYVERDGRWEHLENAKYNGGNVSLQSITTQIGQAQRDASTALNGLEEKVDKTFRINGYTLDDESGVLELTKTDVGLGNVDNTSDMQKPVSTAQQFELDKKVDKTTKVNGYSLSDNITLTKADLGLGNVDNTSDMQKPVSTAQHQAIANAFATEVSDRNIAIRNAISDEVLNRDTAIAAEARERRTADNELRETVSSLNNTLNSLMNGNVTSAIESFREVVGFLEGISDDESLAGLLNGLREGLSAETTSREREVAELGMAVWPLEVELTTGTSVAEYTGSAVRVSVTGSVKRKGELVDDEDVNLITLSVGGSSTNLGRVSNVFQTVDVNTEGVTEITLRASALGMSGAKSVAVRLVRAMYFGFATELRTEAEVKSLMKQAIKVSPVGDYTMTNAEAGRYLWLCVPASMSIAGVSSSGFAVPMEGAVMIGDYRCYRSSNALQSGQISFKIS